MCFVLKCMGGYVKSISDKIISTVCIISSLAGGALLTAKYYKFQPIDDNLTWSETAMPLVVGTGGCLIYNFICYGLQNCIIKKDKFHELELPGIN